MLRRAQIRVVERQQTSRTQRMTGMALMRTPYCFWSEAVDAAIDIYSMIHRNIIIECILIIFVIFKILMTVINWINNSWINLCLVSHQNFLPRRRAPSHHLSAATPLWLRSICRPAPWLLRRCWWFADGCCAVSDATRASEHRQGSQQTVVF